MSPALLNIYGGKLTEETLEKRTNLVVGRERKKIIKYADVYLHKIGEKCHIIENMKRKKLILRS